MAGNLAVCDLTSTTWSGDKCVKSVTNHINPTRTKIYELYKQKCCDSSASWNICGSGTIWQNNLCTADDDNDGVPNSRDTCPGTPAGETVNSNGCSLSQLDAAQATCAHITDGSIGGEFVCGAGFTLKASPSTITCGAMPCADNTDATQKTACCYANTATCAHITDGSIGGEFVCGAGFTLKASPATITCGAMPCADNTDATQKTACCYANTATCAHITDGSIGGEFVCGAGFTLKASPATIPCGAMPCLTNTIQKEACCDEDTDDDGDPTLPTDPGTGF